MMLREHMSRSFFRGFCALRPRLKQKPAPGATLRKLWPYIWPSGRRDLMLRIYVSLALLLAAKIRHDRGSLFVQMGDGRLDRPGAVRHSRA